MLRKRGNSPEYTHMPSLFGSRVLLHERASHEIHLREPLLNGFYVILCVALHFLEVRLELNEALLNSHTVGSGDLLIERLILEKVLCIHELIDILEELCLFVVVGTP